MPIQDRWAGARLPYGSCRVSTKELTDFAREFDPQPMHLDADSEQARRIGGLIASGWHSAALNQRMFVASRLVASCLGDAAKARLLRVNNLRWSAPVRPEDTLSGTATVVSTAAALTLHHELANQHGEIVMTLEAVYGDAVTQAEAVAGGPYLRSELPELLLPFDPITPGMITFTGAHCFEAEAVARYRAAYDPLPEEEEASVAPWHLCAQWLRMKIAHWQALEAAGEKLPERGPGLGLSEAIWPRRARAGETLHFYSRILSARPAASRPGWSIIASRNYGLDAQDNLVFAFSSAALIADSGP